MINNIDNTYVFSERYQVFGELGHGGMGKVFKVYDIRLKRFVALKAFTNNFNSNPGFLKRFIQEAHICAGLKHPNIICIYDIGEYQGCQYFTMEWIEGESLKELLKQERKKISFKRWIRVMTKVCDAIDYAHSMGIIHRDLKPSNIMIKGKDEPIVMDFGIAKATYKETKVTSTGQILGTLNYMPPEQLSGMRYEVDAQSDVYSLGAILYEILTGVCPFHGLSSLEVIAKVSQNISCSPSYIQRRIPKSLECICMKAMSFNKSKRYISAKEMKEDLERYLAGKPVKARGYGYSFHFLLNPKMAIATVAIVFLLLGIFISKLSVSRENIIKENATIEKNKISEKDIKKIEPKPNETKHIPDPSPEVAAPVKPNIERGVWAEFSHPQKSVLKKHAKGLWYIPYRSSLPTDRSGNFLILPVNSCIVFSFDLPEIKKDEYKIKLEIEHLTSMDDSIPGKHRPGFSPISIEVNGKILEKGFNPNDGGPITTSWYIQGHANKGNNIITIKPYIKYTTHYWLSSIRILLE